MNEIVRRKKKLKKKKAEKKPTKVQKNKDIPGSWWYNRVKQNG